MGASFFEVSADGKNANEAFLNAVSDARYEYGHGGYTGTIAEKHDFKLVSKEDFLSIDEVRNFIEKLEDGSVNVSGFDLDDKWGPAGCLKYKTKSGEIRYMFFGYASS